MSLLLRRQGAPAAVGLDESTPSYPLAAQENVYQAFAGQEEIVFVAALSDDTTVYPLAFEMQPLAVAVSSEEFVAPTLAHEEAPPYEWRSDANFIFTVAATQDFTTVAVVDEPPSSAARSIVWEPRFIPLVPDAELALAHLIEDAPIFAAIVDAQTFISWQPSVEEFAGTIPTEEDEPSAFVQHESRWINAFIADDEIPSPHLVDDPGSIVFVQHDQSSSILFPTIDEPFSRPLPPPPPPPPPRNRSRSLVRQRGSGPGPHIEFNWDAFWRDHEKEKRAAEQRRLERQDHKQDFALLPIVGGEMVTAIEDGVIDTFTDEKGNTITRLTAESGTTYFYAKIRNVRVGYVRKGETFGITDESNLAPRALPPAPTVDAKTLSLHGADAENTQPPLPKPVFGVMPVAPPRVPPPEPPPAPPLPAPPQPEPPVLVRTTSAGTVIIMGAIVVGLALGVAWLLSSPSAPRRKPKKNRRRRRRR